MNGRHSRMAHVLPGCIFFLLYLCVNGCSTITTFMGLPQETTATKMIAANKGNVQVLLLGMPGCPGTEKATPWMTSYAKEKLEGVTVARIDVPPPSGTLKRVPDLDPELGYAIDANRDVAGKFEFFFYPTLYVLDQDSVVRYSGDPNMDAVKKMVMEIREEDPTQPKKTYTIPIPKVGTTITNFTSSSLRCGKLALNELPKRKVTFILFSSTTCPYSRKAVQSLPDLTKIFGKNDLSMSIINFGQSRDEIDDFYRKYTSKDVVVMVDEKKEISKDIFKVTVAPFFFILDENRKILARKPYTLDQATSDIAKVLGVHVSCDNESGAG